MESLYLKSALSNDDDARPQLSNAVLCTETKTYHVRQVQSSNSVFVVQSSENLSTNKESLASYGDLMALAQCTTTLELQPLTSSGIEHLKGRLPLYTGTDQEDDENSTPQNNSKPGKNIREIILDDAPFSARELEEAWRTLCVFEMRHRAFRPTAIALINVWKSIMSIVALKSIDLENPFRLDTLIETADEDDHPYPLFKAVILRLSKGDVHSTDHCTSTKNKALTLKLRSQTLP